MLILTKIKLNPGIKTRNDYNLDVRLGIDPNAERDFHKSSKTK